MNLHGYHSQGVASRRAEQTSHMGTPSASATNHKTAICAHCKKHFRTKGNCQWQSTYTGLSKKEKSQGQANICFVPILAPSTRAISTPSAEFPGAASSGDHSRELTNALLTEAVRRAGGWERRGYQPGIQFCLLHAFLYMEGAGTREMDSSLESSWHTASRSHSGM